ncbi:MAG: adenylate/guanylate cyclase domain-containing protein, partial [Gammaproteobacteria bacterium]|nr:adenylate/guanylate cyclase domain-containing protein [Gammaproteobacteria bacterium]
VIKTMGDEVMATFNTVQDSMMAASAMQSNISDRSLVENSSVQIKIRIGCHFGSVVAENNDVFGAAVHTANRLTSQAKARQTLITADTLELLGTDWTESVRQVGMVTLRGQTDEVAMYEVLWSQDDITSVLPEIADVFPSTRKAGRLRLRFQGQEVVLAEDKMYSVTLGRADDCDITIKGNLISRLHARVELKNSRYELLDQSTNGTFLSPESAREVYLRRDSIVLSGRGIMGLGRAADAGTPSAIEYFFEE